MIKEIAFTAYPAQDVAKLRKWYEDTLGLKFSGAYEEEGVERYNEAKVGDGYFSVMTHEWIERDPGSASGVRPLNGNATCPDRCSKVPTHRRRVEKRP